MFFSSIGKTLKFPQPSAVVNQNYIDFLARTYQLSHNGHHGLEHWLRVLINGRLLAEENGADLAVVEHFALVHDVMRENENMDLHHGPRAAEFVKTITGTSWINLDEHQVHLLTEACRYHSVGRIDRNDHSDMLGCRPSRFGTCWNKSKTAFLGSDLARDQNFIEMAFMRSKKRFVEEGFSDG